MAARTSDHCPILVSGSEDDAAPQHYKRGFRFEANWFTNPECQKIIHEAWGPVGLGVPPTQVVQSRPYKKNAHSWHFLNARKHVPGI
jgi:hypothetical protein